MEAILEETIDAQNEKTSSLNCAYLRTTLAFLLRTAYRQKYSILTELNFSFASSKTRPDLCITPKRKANWLVVPTVQTVSILLPDRKQINVSQGTITDPVSGITLNLSDIFEG